MLRPIPRDRGRHELSKRRKARFRKEESDLNLRAR
jgi:hypothetical protein